jgi:hypothetical protein
MSEDLLDLAVATTGGQRLWDTLAGLRIDISIGGPIWALKGWPTGTTFDQILTVDTVSQRILFSPFTRPDREMVFDATTDTVRMQTLDGNTVESLSPPEQASRNAAQQRLGRATSDASWLRLNYFTTPFCSPPRYTPAKSNPAGGGQTWRRLAVHFRHPYYPQPRSSVHFPRAATAHGLRRRSRQRLGGPVHEPSQEL